MGSEARSPEENTSVEGTKAKAHRFNWCLEQRNGIVLYPSSIYGSFQLQMEYNWYRTENILRLLFSWPSNWKPELLLENF